VQGNISSMHLANPATTKHCDIDFSHREIL
jgi:hypothetical protein